MKMISYDMYQDEDHSNKLHVCDIQNGLQIGFVLYRYYYLQQKNFQIELNDFKKKCIISFFIGINFYRKVEDV